LKELHYITLIANVPSIIVNGLLSHNLSQKIAHESCASKEIQGRREEVIVPGGKPLHDYVNVYINARNPMMSLLREKHHSLVILSLSNNILDLPGTIVADRNASRDYCIFKPGAEGLKMIDSKLVFAEYWTHDNEIEQYHHKGAMCAEVLVPYKIESYHIMKAYVSCGDSEKSLKSTLDQAGLDLIIEIAPDLFFQ
jgi:hypothetical protein